jgi:hypothetical protein
VLDEFEFSKLLVAIAVGLILDDSATTLAILDELVEVHGQYN